MRKLHHPAGCVKCHGAQLALPFNHPGAAGQDSPQPKLQDTDTARRPSASDAVSLIPSPAHSAGSGVAPSTKVYQYLRWMNR